MIISRSPFRISFFGGGTDYPVWYREHGGAVLTSTIDKYCYITARYLPPFFDYNYRIRYTEREETQTIAQIKHPSVRACLEQAGLERGVEIQHNSDLPARIGLGSSSAFTVGLMNALYALKGRMMTKRQLALEAISIEQDKIGENVGSQDQTASTFGGFIRIDFGGPQHILVQPVTIGEAKLKFLHDHLMLFFTGFARNASDIAEEQIKLTPQKTKELATLQQMVDEALEVLSGSDERLADFGLLMHDSWMLKRSLTDKIATPSIDEIYEAALKAGALGGKLLGAGGGGCILFFVAPELQPRVRQALDKLLYVPFRFENLGSQIIYYAPEPAIT